MLKKFFYHLSLEPFPHNSQHACLPFVLSQKALAHSCLAILDWQLKCLSLRKSATWQAHAITCMRILN